MKNKVFMGLATVVIIAVLFGCGKAPQAEIDSANAAIEAAKLAEAPVYVPAEFNSVQDSINVVMADIEVQNSKLFKNFGTAKAKLEAITAQANQIAVNAGTRKEEVKKEAETLLTDIKAVIEENAKLITQAPRGKDGAAVIAQIKTDIASIEASLVEAQGQYDKGEYMTSLNTIKAAKERASGINTELKDAIAKVRR